MRILCGKTTATEVMSVSALPEKLERLQQQLRQQAGSYEELLVIKEGLSAELLLRRQASWCLAKMGQNKVREQEVYELLLTLAEEEDTEIRENMLWGLGEVAGSGDERALAVISRDLSSEETALRGMAAWAAGRIMKKLNLFDETLIQKLKTAANDPAPYVRKSAAFALENLAEESNQH